jgi:dipeptidyl aminopeptidase/acylaminoacyl peptidase
MLRNPLRLLPLAAALAVPLAHAAADPSSAPVDPRIAGLLEQLGKVRAISEVALSPDGRKLAWVVKTAGKPTIEIADANGHHAHALGSNGSSGGCRQGDIAWAPDSRQLAFLSDCGQKDGDTVHQQLFVADTTATVPAKQINQLNGYAHALHWSADGKQIAMLYVAGATRQASALAAAKPATGEIGVDGVEMQRIAEIDVTSGQLKELTPADSYIYEFDWSADNRQLVYTAAPAPGDANWWVAKLYTQPAQADAAPRLLVDAGQVSGSLHGLQMALPRFSPDGSKVAFIGGLMSDQGSTGGDIYTVPSAGGAPVNLTADSHVTPNWLHWSGNQRLLVDQTVNGQLQVADYAIEGDHANQTRTLFTLPATLNDGADAKALSLSRDGTQVAFIQSSYSAAPEVHAGALDTTPPPAVTAINAALKPSWGKGESVEWDHDGKHVQGWLLYPAHYDPHKRYPMIVMVHGGPSSAALPEWPHVGFGGAPFSALDYFVFQPNPRGSFGQGEAFVQANRKDFGYGDFSDVLAGVDAVEKKFPVDDNRLGLTGWSYGGYSTMFGVTQTQRFHAAVAGAGVSNWQSYYGQNLIDQWMPPFFGASVYDDPAVYAKSSPITFIKQVKTPTLVVVGDRDAECPAPQSFEFWHALRAQGVPTSLVVYPDEGHRFVKPEHQRDVLQRSLNWFAKYLPANP